jgi:hypothetical protein
MKTILGTSFSPEYVDWISNIPAGKVLKTIKNELKINDIRLGLRWNKIDQGNNQLSLEYYTKYIDYLIQNNSQITLNIGPIKVFRWPEEHIPTYLEKYFIKDLNPESDLAKKSYEYLNKMLELLKKEYGEKIENQTFQIENEGFNRFGHIKMLMDKEHMKKVSQIVKDHFPNAKLMINSAGRTNLRKIVSLIKDFPFDTKDITIGLNFYFRVPHTLPLFPRVNFLKYSYPLDMSIPELQKVQKTKGFNLEISEGQFEPWGIQKTPGNSFDDFEYLIDKSQDLFPDTMEKKLIRLWGTEELAVKIINKELTKEHNKIIDAIRGYQM